MFTRRSAHYRARTIYVLPPGR